MADDDGDGFLSRWARRKALARGGVAAPAPAGPTPSLPPPEPAAAAPGPAAPEERAAPAPADTAAPPPPPSLDEVSALTASSDYSRFVTRDVDPGVRNAALKKLFAAPEYNVMDGLDIYIDDYGRPDPLPAGMLRRMAQSSFLNLFADEDKPALEAPGATPPPPVEETAPDEDPDLRLQPNDAAGPGGAEPGAEPDPGSER